MLARFPRVFWIVLAVLNLSRKNFSNVSQESIVPGFSEVNHVKALSDRVLGNALHNMASSFVTNPITDL